MVTSVSDASGNAIHCYKEALMNLQRINGCCQAAACGIETPADIYA